MTKLTTKQRLYLSDLYTNALRDDPARRLRNALLALTRSDPRWMTWVEQNIPNNAISKPTQQTLQLIETRARALVLKSYSYLGRSMIGQLITLDWPFNDHGHLTPG